MPVSHRRKRRPPAAWGLSSAEAAQAFERAASRLPDVERKKMFGCPCAFAGGQMFALLFNDQWVLRLPETERARLIESGRATPFEPTPGRVLKAYAVLPPETGARQLGSLLKKAHAFALAHPRTPRR